MFREKEICNAIRTAYLYLFPDKKERKRALSRLNMELVVQSVRYRGESVLAYQTAGNHECSLNYYGPELLPQRGFCIYQKTIQSHSTQVEASYIRELWLLEDGRFVEVSCVNTKYRSAYTEYIIYEQPQPKKPDMTASRSKRKRTKTHYRHHNTLFPKCLTGDCLNRNAGTIRLCVMPQGDKFQGVKTQER